MQRLTRERLPHFSLGKGTNAAANTREVISFLVCAHKKKQKKEKIQKKIKRRKSKKNRKRKIKKNRKGKIQKIEKGKIQKKRKKNLFSVVLDKICVFCLYPIPDSQQYVKRGSCRRLILSGLPRLFLFLFLFNVILRIFKIFCIQIMS